MRFLTGFLTGVAVCVAALTLLADPDPYLKGSHNE